MARCSTPNPSDQQKALDKASLRRPVQSHHSAGHRRFIRGWSTGEAFVQSLSEREQVLEIVAEEAKGSIKPAHCPRRLRQHRRKPTTCGIG
ncbi:dihydrodipicolinate synthase family protein [Escherichia coli]